MNTIASAIMIRVAEIQIRADGMVSENATRQMRGQSLSYGEKQFQSLADDLAELHMQMINLPEVTE
jgi:hypothetical protein